jgi:type I restriction-modification system DNA methylase subunit
LDYKKEILRVLSSFSGGWTPYDLFCDWVKLLAISISNSTDLIQGKLWQEREREYLNTIKKYEGAQDKFVDMSGCLTLALEEDMTDVLGAIYMEAGLGNKYTGQFFTPFNISYVTAQTGIPEILEEPITINEPSSGGGGMIIAAAKTLLERGYNPQHYLNIVAQDLDWKGVYMTYVQISLLGLKGIVVQGDTLSDPFTDLRSYPRERVFITPAKKGLLV